MSRFEISYLSSQLAQMAKASADENILCSGQAYLISSTISSKFSKIWGMQDGKTAFHEFYKLVLPDIWAPYPKTNKKLIPNNKENTSKLAF